MLLAVVGWSAARSVRSGAVVESATSAVPARKAFLPPTAPAPWTDTTLSVTERFDRLFAWGQKISSSTEATMGSFELAAQLRDDEFPNALATALQSNAGEGHGVAQMIASYWAERDPAAAVAWLKNLPLVQQADFAGYIGGTWGRMDTNGLLGWLEDLPEEARRRVVAPIVSTFVASVGAQQPERVARLLANFPPSRDGDEYADLFRGWASLDPQTASQRALVLPPGAARSGAVEAVAREWARRDAAASRAWIETLDDAVIAGRAQRAFALGLAENDPRAAAEFAGNMAGTQWSRDVAMQLARRWGEREPDAALRWSENLADPERRGAAANAIIDAVAARDPARAADLFAAHSAEAGPAAQQLDMTAFFSGQQALPNIARGLLAKGGIAAVAGFAQQLPEGLHRAAMSFAILQWAWSEPDALAAWAVRQPENDDRTIGLEMVAQQRAGSDPRGAVGWAQSLPRGSSRDAALGIAAAALLPGDPAAAEQIFRANSSETLRGVAEAAAWQWLMQDSAAARAWIGKTTLFSDDARHRLLETAMPVFPQ